MNLTKRLTSIQKSLNSDAMIRLLDDIIKVVSKLEQENAELKRIIIQDRKNKLLEDGEL